MTQLIARFAVEDWDVRVVTGVNDTEDQGWVDVARMQKTFTTGIVGSSTVLFLSSGADEGQRSYIAAERITGLVDGAGEPGAVTVHHGGLESDPDTWFGHVVPGSGTGALAGWTGSARIQHDDEGAFFSFDLR